MSKRTSKKTTKTAQTPYSKKITRFNAIIEKTENLSEDKRAMDELRLMSISTGGCVNDNMRKKVWPLLIHAAEHDHLKRIFLY
jgi:type IV secretory pathway TrbF-like protein